MQFQEIEEFDPTKDTILQIDYVFAIGINNDKETITTKVALQSIKRTIECVYLIMCCIW